MATFVGDFIVSVLAHIALRNLLWPATANQLRRPTEEYTHCTGWLLRLLASELCCAAESTLCIHLFYVPWLLILQDCWRLVRQLVSHWRGGPRIPYFCNFSNDFIIGSIKGFRKILFVAGFSLPVRSRIPRLDESLSLPV